MKIKTTLKFLLTPVRMTKINKTTTNKLWRKRGGKGLVVQLKTGGITLEISVKNPQKAKSKSAM